MEKSVIIIGAGGLGKSSLEVFKRNDIAVYCFLDEDKQLHKQEIDGVSVMGSPDDDELLKYLGKDCAAFVAVEDVDKKALYTQMLIDQYKTMPVNAIDSGVVFSGSSSIGHGNFIGSNVILGAEVSMKNHCVIGTGAILEREVEIGSYVQIGAGAIIGHRVKVKKGALISVGAIIGPGIVVGENAKIGPGAVVVKNVEAGKTVFGNPAQAV